MADLRRAGLADRTGDRDGSERGPEAGGRQFRKARWASYAQRCASGHSLGLTWGGRVR